MMNAGLEQYIYERLGEPAVKIVEPVSNPIKAFDKIDWVKEISADEEQQNPEAAPKLLLIGSCDLTAVASYCSGDRLEFVNGVKNGVMTRYDDFGFILGNHEKIAASTLLDKMPCWDKNDFFSFHDRLASSDLLIVSLSAALWGAHLLTKDGVAVRVNPELGDYIDGHPWEDFLKGSKFYALSRQQRGDLLKTSLEFIDASSTGAKHKFLLGANTREVAGFARNGYEPEHYNAICEAFCRSNANWHFVSIDEVVSADKLVDDRHYTRVGYFDIANYINDKVRTAESVEVAKDVAPPADVGLGDLIRSGRQLGRLNLFGGKQGAVQHVKRAVKLTPLSGVLRKALVRSKKVA
jgi:hypothetical protein